MTKNPNGRTIVAAAASVLVLLSGVAVDRPAAQMPTSKRLLGSWRLVAYRGVEPIDPVRGARPTGMLYYDATGHMAAQVMPERSRPAYSGTDPTPEEARGALAGYAAYFGTYTVDERARTVTHHRQGSINPGDVGTDFVRRYEFVTEDRIVLTPVEPPSRVLTWERIK